MRQPGHADDVLRPDPTAGVSLRRDRSRCKRGHAFETMPTNRGDVRSWMLDVGLTGSAPENSDGYARSVRGRKVRSAAGTSLKNWRLRAMEPFHSAGTSSSKKIAVTGQTTSQA